MTEAHTGRTFFFFFFAGGQPMMADVKRPTTGAVLSRPVARHRAEVVVIGSQARRNRSIAGLRVVRSYPVMRIYPAAAIVIDNDDRVVVVWWKSAEPLISSANFSKVAAQPAAGETPSSSKPGNHTV